MMGLLREYQINKNQMVQVQSDKVIRKPRRKNHQGHNIKKEVVDNIFVI